MLQQIADYFSKPKPIFAPVHNGNVLVITANIKQGTLTVSHKGKVKAAKFGDNTLRNMMNGVRFRKNTEVFVTAIAQLLEQLTDQEHAGKEKGI